MSTESTPTPRSGVAQDIQPAPRFAVSALVTNLREYGLVLALIAIMVFFQFTTNGTLFKPVNLSNLVQQNSFIIVMALGMLLVIVSGHIDSQRRLGRRLHRRAGRHDDGHLAARLPQQSAGRVDRLPDHRWRHRRGAGLLGRLSSNTELHRHAGRHADLPGHVPGAARRRLLGRAAARRIQGAQLGLHSRSDRDMGNRSADRQRRRQDHRRQRPVASHDHHRHRRHRRAGLHLFRSEGAAHARGPRLSCRALRAVRRKDAGDQRAGALPLLPVRDLSRPADRAGGDGPADRRCSCSSPSA